MTRQSSRLAFIFLLGVLSVDETYARRPGLRTCRCRPACPAVTSTPGTVPQSRVITTPARTKHLIVPSTEKDPADLEEIEDPSSPFDDARAQRWDGADGETFAGLARRRAKTSISESDSEVFTSLFDLLNDLPSDEDMRDGDPDIERGADSDRTDLENRNIEVPVFLYAASREDDNDFHLIVGDSPRSNSPLMNVEVSGLPPSGPDRPVLVEVRNEFEEVLDGNLPGESYDFYQPPIPVRISGSLFYDIDHPPGQVGPSSLRNRLESAWEIHPITSLSAE